MSAHVLELLSAYLDGELAAPERVRVQGHLGECVECSRRMEELAAVDEIARALPAEAPEAYFDGFASRVRARLSPRPRASSWRLPVWTLAVAAGLFLAVLTPALIERTSLAPAPAPSWEPPAERAVPAATPAPLDATGGRARLGAEAPSTSPARKALDVRKPAAESKTPESDRLEAPKKAREAFATSKNAPEAVTSAVVAATPAPPPPPAHEDLHSLGYAPPPQTARPAPAAAPHAAAAPAARREVQERQEGRDAAEAVGALKEAPAEKNEAAGRIDARRKDAGVASSLERRAAASPEEARYQGLRARPYPTSAEEARVVREAWRAFARAYPEGPRADEARVRVVELGGEAYRLAADPRDLAQLRSDAAAYLARKDAVQKDLVREILRELE